MRRSVQRSLGVLPEGLISYRETAMNLDEMSVKSDWLMPQRRLGDAASGAHSHRIVMACDEDYAMPLATALRSLVDADRTGDSLEVIVLCSKFSPGMKEKVANSLPESSVNIQWMEVELDLFSDLSTLPYISKTTFARLLLPYCLPKGISKVLYLDSDILVLGDLTALWETDLEGHAFGAVVDSHSSINAERLGITGGIAGQSDSLNGEYFNAGVLLIDLAKWRQDRLSDKAIDYLTANPDSRLADQDALNIASGGHWKRLDPRWNCLHHPSDGFNKMPAANRPSIVHYAGSGKPWLAASLSVDRNFYDGFRGRTQFARSAGERSRDLVEHSWTSMKAFARRHGITPLVRGWLGNRRQADCV